MISSASSPAAPVLGIIAAKAVAAPVAAAPVAAAPVAAAPVAAAPNSYDMLNGCACLGIYTDACYSGAGNRNVTSSARSGGTGELTDGVIPTANWNVSAAPYVGWKSETISVPTITFHFASVANLNSITLHYDDANGAGGVMTPLGFSFRKTGGPTLTQTVIDLVGSAPASTTLVFGSALVGDSFVLAVDNTRGLATWAMISEVSFLSATAVPPPAAAPLMLAGLRAFGLMARRRRG